MQRARSLGVSELSERLRDRRTENLRGGLWLDLWTSKHPAIFKDTVIDQPTGMFRKVANMGWWQARSNNELVVGDIPLDALGAAISAVLDAYSGHLGRPPTIKEWEMLFGLALDSKSGRVFEDGVNESVVVTIACTSESSDGDGS